MHFPLIVLVRPKTASNIGAVARVMRNFGASQLVLVRPQAEPTDPRALLLATHSADILEQCAIVGELAEAVTGCSVVAATSSRTGGLFRTQAAGTAEQIIPGLIATASEQQPLALVFGPEDDGLSNDDIAQCSHLIRIPTTEEHPALNLAQAVAICLYEWRRWAVPQPPPEASEPMPTAGELELMFGRLEEALRRIHFLYGPKADALLFALRRLLGRAQPDAREVKLLLGLARQIQWFADHATEQLS